MRDTRRGFVRHVGLAGGAAALSALAGCSQGGNGGGSGGGTTVEMTDDLAFDPETIEVSVGATVTWKNVGSVRHSVTAYEDGLPDGASYFAAGGFESVSAARDAYPEGALGGSETYEHTFETAGEYGYFCIPHESAGMTGTVVVTE